MTLTPTNRVLTLELDDRNIGLLSDILARLEQHWELTIESGLRLGGGTALAMHWDHRFSTDIDLSVPEGEYQKGWRRGGQSLREYLVKQREEGQIRRMRCTPGGLSWRRLNSGEVSLSISKRRRRNPTHRESSTGIPVVVIRDILEGKLFGRVLGFNLLLARDAYDLCTAAERVPRVFKQVIERVYKDRPEDVMILINRIKSSNVRIIEGRPIIEPTDTGLTYDPWRRFVEFVEPILREVNDEWEQERNLTR